MVLASFSTISRHPDGGAVKNTKFCSQDTGSQSRDELSTSPNTNSACLVLKKIGKIHYTSCILLKTQ